ncbi:hypothetical protein PoB_002273200 [Plakobranchus ocellatus]|uniref:Uncharacterized protein n=1 Tax=Plakobranchus ocellatus TaxID=259542 RepID=A0AAV3ZLX8_9GAST|nr:hypothetical protein PoB_002273200 [Plakobranchus ocellatus]
MASESALRSAGTLLLRIRAPPLARWPDGGPKSLRSPCCGLAILKKTIYICTRLFCRESEPRHRLPWLDGEPEGLRSLCCGLAIHTNQTNLQVQDLEKIRAFKFSHPFHYYYPYCTLMPELIMNFILSNCAAFTLVLISKS